MQAVADPVNDIGRRRVLRGGSWVSSPRNCRSACRGNSEPAFRGVNNGFRVVLRPAPGEEVVVNAIVDPARTGDARLRVLRGGCWSSRAGYPRSANRGWGVLEGRNEGLGVRLALNEVLEVDAVVDPVNEPGTARVLRGGSFSNHPADVCAANRVLSRPSNRNYADSLRPALSDATCPGNSVLASIPEHPANALIAADWLDEQGDPSGELLRLVYTLTGLQPVPDRPALEARMQELLNRGVHPVGPYLYLHLGSDVWLSLVWIPPGFFVQGSPSTEPNRHNDEVQRPVVLTRGFWLSVGLITQSQWQVIMGNNPSRFRGSDRPVETVSWDNCQRFCQRLAEQTGLHGWSLPTEAQWEYACRAGTTTPYHCGETITNDQARFGADSTCDVGSFKPNAFGLYDMHGNVWEWCNDWYSPYTGEPVALSDKLIGKVARR